MQENSKLKSWKAFLPGLRNIKTALTVVICVLLGEIGPFSSPFFMALAGIITVQVSTIDSFNMGRNRIQGTIVGATVGLLFALIGPENPILAGIGIIVVIQICDRFHMNSAIQIATVVFMAIMVNMGGNDPVVYSLSRLVDTSVGVIVALLVNYFIFPYNNLPVIAEGFKDLEQLVQKVLEPVLLLENTEAQKKIELEELDPTRQKLLWIRDQIKLYEQEVTVKKNRQGEILPYKTKHEVYWDIFEHMKHLKMIARDINSASCEEGCVNVLDCQELYIVYEYHLKQIKEDLKRLKPLSEWV